MPNTLADNSIFSPATFCPQAISGVDIGRKIAATLLYFNAPTSGILSSKLNLTILNV
jgi:hypothetical protein